MTTTMQRALRKQQQLREERQAREAASLAAWEQVQADGRRRWDDGQRRIGWLKDKPDEEERKTALAAAAEVGVRSRQRQAEYETWRRQLVAETNAARAAVDAALAARDLDAAVAAEIRSRALDGLARKVEAAAPTWVASKPVSATAGPA